MGGEGAGGGNRRIDGVVVRLVLCVCTTGGNLLAVYSDETKWYGLGGAGGRMGGNRRIDYYPYLATGPKWHGIGWETEAA